MLIKVKEVMTWTKAEKDELEKIKSQVAEIKDKVNKIMNIVKGIAIGLIIGAALAGVYKLSDIIGFLK